MKVISESQSEWTKEMSCSLSYIIKCPLEISDHELKRTSQYHLRSATYTGEKVGGEQNRIQLSRISYS